MQNINAYRRTSPTSDTDIGICDRPIFTWMSTEQTRSQTTNAETPVRIMLQIQITHLSEWWRLFCLCSPDTPLITSVESGQRPLPTFLARKCIITPKCFSSQFGKWVQYPPPAVGGHPQLAVVLRAAQKNFVLSAVTSSSFNKSGLTTNLFRDRQSITACWINFMSFLQIYRHEPVPHWNNMYPASTMPCLWNCDFNWNLFFLFHLFPSFVVFCIMRTICFWLLILEQKWALTIYHSREFFLSSMKTETRINAIH